MVTIKGLDVTDFQLGLILDALSDAADQSRQFDREDIAEQYEQLRRAFRLIGEQQTSVL
jgi:hypothetical protein